MSLGRELHARPPLLQPQCLHFHKFDNLIRLKDRVRNDSGFLMWFSGEGGEKKADEFQLFRRVKRKEAF